MGKGNSDWPDGLTARRVRTSTKAAGAIPLIILASFYLYAASVRVAMGGFPDPGTLPEPFKTLEIIVGAPLVLLFPLATLAVPVLVLSFFRPFAALRSSSAAFLCTATFVIAIATLDPGGIFAWFMD